MRDHNALETTRKKASADEAPHGHEARKLFPYDRENLVLTLTICAPAGKGFDLSCDHHSDAGPIGDQKILNPRPWRDAGVSRPRAENVGEINRMFPDGQSEPSRSASACLPRTHIGPCDDERRQRLIEPHRRTSDAEPFRHWRSEQSCLVALIVTDIGTQAEAFLRSRSRLRSLCA